MKSIHIRDIDAKRHHRSLQGELHNILEEAAEKALFLKNNKAFEITTVRKGIKTTWRREEMYGNQDR